MGSHPLVTIITPLFNRLEDISLTMKSVVQQTYKHWEWIVVDDGSNDGSYEFMQDVATQDKRIIIKKRYRKPKSASTCRNIGIGLAQGVFLMFLDSDDLLAPGCLENRLSLMKDEDFIVTQTGIIRKEKALIRKYWSSLTHQNDIEAFLKLEGWCISSTFFRSSFAKNYTFDETAMSLQDWGFHLRMLIDRPKYSKYHNSNPDIYVRSGHSDRISVKNRNLDRVKNRFDTFLKIESLLSGLECQEHINLLDKHYLKHLREVLEFHTLDDFRRLYALWKHSITYQSKPGRMIRRYLMFQFYLKKLHLHFLKGLGYRISKQIFSERLFEASRREVILKKPFFLEQELQILLNSK